MDKKYIMIVVLTLALPSCPHPRRYCCIQKQEPELVRLSIRYAEDQDAE